MTQPPSSDADRDAPLPHVAGKKRGTKRPTPRGVTVSLDYEPDIRGAAAAILAVLGDTDAPPPPPSNVAGFYDVLRRVADEHPDAFAAFQAERAAQQGDDEEQ